MRLVQLYKIYSHIDAVVAIGKKAEAVGDEELEVIEASVGNKHLLASGETAALAGLVRLGKATSRYSLGGAFAQHSGGVADMGKVQTRVFNKSEGGCGA